MAQPNKAGKVQVVQRPPSVTPEAMAEQKVLPDEPKMVVKVEKEMTSEEEAHACLWRMKLQVDMLRAEVNRLLKGPLAGKFRKAAAIEMAQIGGDAREWKPLDTILRVVEQLKPLAGPVCPPSQ